MHCRGGGTARRILAAVEGEVVGRINSGDIPPEVVERSIESFERRPVVRGRLCGGGSTIPVSCLMDAVRVSPVGVGGGIGVDGAVLSMIADRLFKEAAAGVGVKGVVPVFGTACEWFGELGVYVCGEPDLLLYKGGGLLGVVEHKVALTFGEYRGTVRRGLIQALMYAWLFRDYYVEPVDWVWVFVVVTRYSTSRVGARGRVASFCVRVGDSVRGLIVDAYRALRGGGVVEVDDCRLAGLLGGSCLGGRVAFPASVVADGLNLAFRGWRLVEG
jgi:hypothetical protein